MKILIVGGGAREHALAWKMSLNPIVQKIYCAPGNDGMLEIAEKVPIQVHQIEELCHFANKHMIDLTVVGPELPLTLGIVDLFEKQKLPIFGPRKEAAILEASKVWTKRFLQEEGIPTASFADFDDHDQALNYVKSCPFPLVIKADGLASGKGVFICQTLEEATGALQSLFREKIFGVAGSRVVIEEFLVGEEASFHALVDGNSILPLVSSQDHKQVWDGDQGPNTGGMGAYASAPVVTTAMKQKIIDMILQPTVEGLKKRGIFYQGVLYAGVMITKEGPKLLEYNVRFGDPETQPLMMKMDGRLVEAMLVTMDGKLKGRSLPWKKGSALGVVLAAEGYPGPVVTGDEIHGLKEVGDLEEVKVFHGGTKKAGNYFVTDGGRVMTVTAFGDTLEVARKRAYEVCEKIRWRGMHYRKDIGFKGIQRTKKVE